MARPQLKALVADVVAEMLVDHRLARVAAVPDVTEVTITHPTPLITQIRVVTENSGVHYFEVRVKEKY